MGEEDPQPGREYARGFKHGVGDTLRLIVVVLWMMAGAVFIASAAERGNPSLIYAVVVCLLVPGLGFLAFVIIGWLFDP